MAEEQVKVKIGVEGAESSAKKMDMFGASMKAANDNAKKLSEGASKTATTFAALGGSLRTINPLVGEFGEAVGRSAGSIQAMTAVLGGGVGLAVGGAIAAMGLFASAMEAASQRSKELAEWQAKVAKEAKDASDALTASSKSYFDIVRGEVQIQNDIAETKRRIGELAQQGGFDTQRAGGIDFYAGNLTTGQKKQLTGLQTRLGSLNTELLAEQERKRKEAEAAAKRGGSDGPAANAFGITEYTRNQGQLTGGTSEIESYKKAQALLEQQQKDVLDRKKQENADFLEANKSAFDQTLEDARAYDAEKAQIDDAQKKRYDELRGAGVSTFSAVAAQGLEAFHKLAKGQKTSVREIISGIGDTIWAQGIGHLLLGTANAFIPGMQGTSAGLIGVGLAEMAVGLGMGAATRGSGAGGGRGRSESPLVNSPQQGGGGGNTYITNVSALTMSPNADLGAEIEKHTNEKRRIYGSAA